MKNQHAKQAAPVAPVGAGVKLSGEQTAAVLAAGRLLQSRGWPGGRKTIVRKNRETYPEAVMRIIAELPPDERGRLRELAAWVRSYERED